MKKIIFAIAAAIIALTGFSTQAAKIATASFNLYDNNGPVKEKNVTVRVSFYGQDVTFDNENFNPVYTPTGEILSQYKMALTTDINGVLTMKFNPEFLISGNDITEIDEKYIADITLEIDPLGGENYTMTNEHIEPEFFLFSYVETAKTSISSTYAEVSQMSLDAGAVGDVKVTGVTVRLQTPSGWENAFSTAVVNIAGKEARIGDATALELLQYHPVYVTVSMSEEQFKSVSKIKFFINAEEIEVVKRGTVGYVFYEKYDPDLGYTTTETAEVYTKTPTLDDYKNVLVGPFPYEYNNNLTITIEPQIN